MKITCPNCGANFENGSKFCNKCGTKLENQTTVEPVCDTAPANNQPVEYVPEYEAPSNEPITPPVLTKTPSNNPAPSTKAAPKKGKKKTGLIVGILGGIVGIPMLLIIVLIIALSGGDDPDVEDTTVPPTIQETQPVAQLSDDIFDFDISLNDVVYKIPATINDFETNGWIISDDIKADMVEPGEVVEISAKNDSGYITLAIYNDSEATKTVKDCIVGGLGVSFNRSNTYTVELSKELIINESSTLDDVVTSWGKYSYIEGFNYFYEKVRTNNNTCTYTFTTTADGTLTFVGIENYNTDDVREPSTIEYVIANIAPAVEAPTNNLSDGIITFEGKFIAIPSKASEIINAEGWQTYIGSTKLAPHETSSVYLVKNARTYGFNDSVFLTVINTTDEEIAIEDATVIGIDYSDFNNMDSLEFANSIKLGMTESDFLKATNNFEFTVEDVTDATYYRSSSDEGGFEYTFIFREDDKLESMLISYNIVTDIDAMLLEGYGDTVTE